MSTWVATLPCVPNTSLNCLETYQIQRRKNFANLFLIQSAGYMPVGSDRYFPPSDIAALWEDLPWPVIALLEAPFVDHNKDSLTHTQISPLYSSEMQKKYKKAKNAEIQKTQKK